jgi:hypothetical protein
MTTEKLLGSKIAGGRRINLHDNLTWISSKKDKYWMGFNETCAYLHTQISESGENAFSLELNYDDHYCKYFERKPSRWTLELSDEFRNWKRMLWFMSTGRKPELKPVRERL